MTDRRSAALDRLASRLTGRAGQAATYKRSGEVDVAVTGTFTDPASDGEIGRIATAAGLDLATVDFVCSVAGLGGMFPPATGDSIEADFSGTTREFAVTRQDGEDTYRFADPLRKIVRIHLRHVGEA